MKYIPVIALVLVLALCLFGCAGREDDTSSPSSVWEQSSAPSPMEKAPVNLAVGQLYAAVGENPQNAFDQDSSTHWRGSSLEITFASPTAVSQLICHQEGSDTPSFSVYGKGEDGQSQLLYQQDEIGANRMCTFPQPQTVTALELRFTGAVTLSEVEIYQLENALPTENFRTLAYLPATSDLLNGDTRPSSFGELTDVVIISGAAWDENGNIVVTDDNLSPTTTQVAALTAQSDTRIWHTIFPKGSVIRAGAAGSTISTSEKRTHLIQSILSHMETYSLDGIDIDWEFPLNEQEWEYFSLLLVELKDALRQEGKLLSAAFYPEEMAISKEAIASLDYLNAMVYDLFDEDGKQSTYTAVTDAIRYFTKKGVAKEQLNLGIPFYGRPLDQSARWDLYKDFGDYTDPYLNLRGDSYFNSPTLVRDKTALAVWEGLGGVMLYHLYCDLPLDSPHSLTKAVGDYLDFVSH